MFAAIFWTSLAVLLFTYIGYPVLVTVAARIARGTLKSGDHRPFVSILIPAYNEAGTIEQVLRDKLNQTYPSDRLEILVVSDESIDGTDQIVERVASETDVAVRLHRQAPRQGKTAGLNTIADMAIGEVLAFADANSFWANDAVARLVRNFADAEVGYVTGKMVYTQQDGSMVGDGCSAYMKFENWLREQETRIGSIVGVDGAIDAMRRELFKPLRPDQLSDFVQPLYVIEQGYRVIYEPEAVLHEPSNADNSSEYGMRVRVTLQAMWALKDMAHLMNPLRYGHFALQLIGHKVLRYASFIPLALLALSTLVLLNDAWLYALAAIGQVIFYALAWRGMRVASQKARLWETIPCYFTLLNLACAHAAVGFWQGQRKAIWTPRQG